MNETLAILLLFLLMISLEKGKKKLRMFAHHMSI